MIVKEGRGAKKKKRRQEVDCNRSPEASVLSEDIYPPTFFPFPAYLCVCACLLYRLKCDYYGAWQYLLKAVAAATPRDLSLTLFPSFATGTVSSFLYMEDGVSLPQVPAAATAAATGRFESR